ncbi:MAG: CusA/CzcA family heavy metal efflux RND transporter [Bacteroidota bacterium]|nr:CusA/CzcA family heavy metal efflux RND transporter [Candidatus Kapabacteria bacterium]MDW8220467.1 CusA/CzcA family heavy metal efflux RND transporter [Bacteroidota bacterium]
MLPFIRAIITFSLKNRSFTLFWVSVLVVAGIIAFRTMPIEAFPDVTNTQIIIVTEWNGRSAEEIERFVTAPIEIALNSVQRKTSVRSITMFGLSVIKVIFDDDVEDFFARQQVNNQLRNVSLPEGVEPEVQPPYGPTGEIFRYVLHSPDRDTRELLTLQNWVIDRQLRSVPGVADVVAFGGQEKIYEISVDPGLLSKYDITPLEVYRAVNASNLNVGGDIIEKNGQAYVVRGIGLLQSIEDIENIIVDEVDGSPVLVKNLARVHESSLPRVGQAGLDDNDDVVEGIVVMRKNENPREVLRRVKAKIQELHSALPADVRIQTFYDRDNLMDYTTSTVMHNVIEGIVLVTVVVFLFMADWRTTLIVSIVIPLSLLFAFLCLKLKGMSANLLSLGAVDFGIIIDGAVVMVEGVFVALDRVAHKLGMERFNRLAKAGIIRKTGTEMGKAIFFSKLIIITALVPIFTFEKVEGKMFSPLAYTLGFALLGALLFTLTLVPMLSHILLNNNVYEKHNRFVRFWNAIVEWGFSLTFRHKKTTLVASLLFLVVALCSTTFLGTEFLPQLNEGALWITAELPMSMTLSESMKITNELRYRLRAFPEVESVLSQTGRSNDGTDPNGFYFVQFQVNLLPKESWKRAKTMDELIAEMERELLEYQGITYNFSQPIIDNVAEAAAGIKASNAIKIYGNDLSKLDDLANKVIASIQHIEGVKDVGILRNLGQPEISVLLDKERMAAYGVTIADAQAVLEMAFGGKTATQKYEGEWKFDVRVRYERDYRKDEKDILNLKVPTIHGAKIPMKEICSLKTVTGPAFIYRDNTQRFIGVKFSVRGRDLGSTIAEAQENVKNHVQLPRGYGIGWTGEFENQVRATQRLAQVVPISLLTIFVLLFAMFGTMKDALLVLANVPFALIGGIIALHVTGINFGISAGVGFIALFGICVQNGVLLITEFHNNIKLGEDLDTAIVHAIRMRARPVVMTALMASIGLLPAAISTGIGSESQKPLAIVIIGGLVTATALTLLVFPIIFWVFHRKMKPSFT